MCTSEVCELLCFKDRHRSADKALSAPAIADSTSCHSLQQSVSVPEQVCVCVLKEGDMAH